MSTTSYMSVPQQVLTNKFEKKETTANITSSGNIAGLTFTNLVVGKSYEVNVRAFSSTTGGGIYIDGYHNGNLIVRAGFNGADSGASATSYSTLHKFVATATTITFDSNRSGGATLLSGSYVELTELNDEVAGTF